jgi:alkanesulfonate monooxygenase SsuD/methylene tetrahydromethanopterin reductase-like flavin-dependent oxidoreductase (luciferase family)
MRSLWFHLMPYQDLPDNFKDEHPSIWVSIDRTLFDSQRGHELYNEYMDELEFAAAQGFDAICVNEHHANAYGLMPSPNLIAASLARRTSDAAICVMGNSVALYNPPTRVAEEMAMIDCISGGRLIAGFPVGTAMDTCYAYGQNPGLLRPRYHEAIDLITRAWESDEPFAFNGRFNQQRYVNAWPRPIQKPRPPVWIPGSGSIETWDMCAEKDFLYAYLSYFGWQSSAGVMKGFWDRMKELGKEPNPFHAGFLQFVGVAETRAEAEKLYARHADYFYNRCLHLDPGFSSPPGYTTEESIRARMNSQVAAAAGAASGGPQTVSRDFSKTRFFDEGHVIIGSPDEVADKLREVAVQLNVGNILLLMHFGDMPRELTEYNTSLFAKKVLPQIKGLFEDEWEHKWWPKPIAPRQRQHPAPVTAFAS